MKKRYSEEQIIGALKRQEAGTTVSDLCRELGISAGTFYNWRSKYGGLEVNEAMRLRELKSQLLNPAPEGAFLEIKLGTNIPDAVALVQYQAGSFSFELPRKRTFRSHLNTPSPVEGYHLKACPKSVDHYNRTPG